MPPAEPEPLEADEQCIEIEQQQQQFAAQRAVQRMVVPEVNGHMSASVEAH